MPPPKEPNIPKEAQWLGGQGVGSWFYLSKPKELAKNNYRIVRYAPNGDIECNRIFETSEYFDINQPYQFTYISHCQQCTIIQNNKKLLFNYLKEY